MFQNTTPRPPLPSPITCSLPVCIGYTPHHVEFCSMCLFYLCAGQGDGSSGPSRTEILPLPLWPRFSRSSRFLLKATLEKAVTDALLWHRYRVIHGRLYRSMLPSSALVLIDLFHTSPSSYLQLYHLLLFRDLQSLIGDEWNFSCPIPLFRTQVLV